MRLLTRILRFVAVGLVQFYRLFISPLIGPKCRFAPSCSEYALEALRTHKLFYATRLISRRILRCHPWGGHGFDPVPPPPGQEICAADRNIS